MNKSWINEGSGAELRDSLALTNIPENYPPDTDYYARRLSEPWQSDPDLTDAVFTRVVESADFNNAVDSGAIQRGHLTAFRDRDRDAKDAVATFLTTNLIP